MKDTSTLTSQVDAWLQPVEDAPRRSGRPVPSETLREFRSALAGKPDTQFSEAVPPDFRKVIALAETVFADSRDLTVAVGWCRAALRTQGIAALPEGLRLLQRLLQTFQEDLYPQADADDGSYYARNNAISVVAETDGLLGDLRQTVLLADRVHGDVRTRTIEVALGKLAPREGELPLTLEQVRKLFTDTAGATSLREIPNEARTQALVLSATLAEQVDAAETADLSPLVALLNTCLSVIPGNLATEEGVNLEGPQPLAQAQLSLGIGAQIPPLAAKQAMSCAIQSRADVIRVIDMACDYLEHAEPSNPAQLLLRRAKHLLDHNFLQLIHVLVPNALEEVARLMGVDTATLTSPSDKA